MAFPIVFIYSEFDFGNEFWKSLLALFFVFFPVLILSDYIFQRFLIRSKRLRFIILLLLLIGSEIAFSYLPVEFTQVQYHGSSFTVLILFLFAIPAAYCVNLILQNNKEVVIIQKEI